MYQVYLHILKRSHQFYLVGMKLYKKPWYYVVFHMLFGFSAVWFPTIGILALLWQLGQYITKVRIFTLEMKVEKGNSAEHTLIKLGEIIAGFVIGYCVKQALFV